MDGPDGNRDHPAKMAGGFGEGAIRRNLVARYARAPKSVIHLKVSQGITRVPFRENPGGSAPVPPATFLRRPAQGRPPAKP